MKGGGRYTFSDTSAGKVVDLSGVTESERVVKDAGAVPVFQTTVKGRTGPGEFALQFAFVKVGIPCDNRETALSSPDMVFRRLFHDGGEFFMAIRGGGDFTRKRRRVVSAACGFAQPVLRMPAAMPLMAMRRASWTSAGPPFRTRASNSACRMLSGNT